MKMTQRDKILLIILAIVFVVAIVIVAPNFGVMDCNSRIETAETKIEAINLELADQLAELRAKGISETDALYYTIANKNLLKKIHDQKVEAARLSETIFANTESWDVDEQWLKPLKYFGAVLAGEEDELLDYNERTNEGLDKSQGTETKELTVDNAIYSLPVAYRRVTFTDTDTLKCRVELEYNAEGYDDTKFGALVLYLQQLEAKGSIQIVKVTYDVQSGEGVVEFRVLMTENGDLVNYAGELQREKEAEEEAAQNAVS